VLAAGKLLGRASAVHLLIRFFHRFTNLLGHTELIMALGNVLEQTFQEMAAISEKNDDASGRFRFNDSIMRWERCFVCLRRKVLSFSAVSVIWRRHRSSSHPSRPTSDGT